MQTELENSFFVLNFADEINVTIQMDRLKAEDCQGKAHFEAMLDARIRHFRQNTAIVLL